MNPLFWGKDRNSSQGGEEWVYLKWTSGAAGAVPATLTTFTNVVSVVHGATGVYVVTFGFGGPPYDELLFLPSPVRQASYANTGADKVRETAISLANGTATLLVTDAASGAAVEPADGDVISMAWVFQRYKGNNNG